MEREKEDANINSELKIQDEKYLENSILTFICKLYSNVTVTRTVVQEIVSEFISFIYNLVEGFSTMMKSQLPTDYHYIVDNFKYSNIINNLSTDFKRKKFLEKAHALVQPEKIFLGEINMNKKQNGKTILLRKKCYGYFIPMRETLKQILELPNVFKQITDFIMAEEARGKTENIYTSLFQGKKWQYIMEQFTEKIVIPLYLYYDDFEVNNPLSPSAGLHKIGGLYYSIAALPPKFASTLQNVFLGQFIYTSHLKEFGNENCFRRVIDEFKFLAENGITISVDGVPKKIYFVLIGILGDNLGLNTIFGFNQSFVSHYFCRICRAHKASARILCEEKENLLRNETNYDDDLNKLTTGIRSKCYFNDVPFFHLTQNKVCDLMHDIYLGVARYVMAKVIHYCIESQYFTLERLNDRLKYFDHSELDRGNRFSKVKEKHLSDGCIISTAAEMSFLITYFSIIVGDLIPDDDLVWELYLTLVEVTHVITSHTISENDIVYLTQLVKSLNEQFMTLFRETLKPKFHFLTHYATVIRVLGPPRYYSCQKFEAFHKLSKKYAQLVTSRVNFLFTIAIKIQLQMCFRILSHKGFSDELDFGKVISTVKYLPVPAPSKSIFYEVLYAKVNGTVYRKDNAIYIGTDSQDDPIIGIIQSVVKNDSKTYFMIKLCECITFDYHTRSYQLQLPSKTAPDRLYELDINNFVRPMKVHKTTDGKTVVCRRDIE